MRSIRSWLGRMSKKWRLGPRSNGLPVRRGTAVHIKFANVARTRQDWAAAASGYRQAVTNEPHLQHLWVQLGHMEKEAGAIDRATAAYEEAARLQPEKAEPLIHLGHMAKAWSQPAEAANYFIRALQRDRANLEALSELARVMPEREALEDGIWIDALTVLEVEPAAHKAQDHRRLPPGAVLLDVTDLIAFFGQRRLPTGIQRVQIEISLAALEDKIRPIFCIYASARRGWIRLDDDRFETLCRLAKQSDDTEDPAWRDHLGHLYRTIAVSRTALFPYCGILVNLGTSWADRNYLLDVRTIRTRDAIIYVPLVFDLIPLIEPLWFMQSLVRDYRAWFGSLLHSADGYIAISQATRRDLIEKSMQWNASVPADAIPVVRLDGDFRQGSTSTDILQAYSLEGQNYVLLVSTLEPRKNHIGAFKAWITLANRLGESALPNLVCVGGRGWLNEDMHQMLRDHPALQRMVHILHGIPDDELATLYEHCLFALYPSLYEGWGLPVSEALSYGKVPAISNISSLPEAGGSFARYFDPYDAADIATTVCTLLDKETRLGAEAEIQRLYVPQSWRQIATDLIAKARMIPSRTHDTMPRITGAGVWPMSLSRQADDDMISGESLRHGHSWLSPTVTGCGIRGDDAALWFHWSGLANAYVHIHMMATGDPVTIAIGLNSLLIQQPAHGPTILSCPLPNVAGPIQLSITPSAGEIIVEKIVISCKI